jgi:hypothetical protein
MLFGLPTQAQPHRKTAYAKYTHIATPVVPASHLVTTYEERLIGLVNNKERYSPSAMFFEFATVSATMVKPIIIGRIAFRRVGISDSAVALSALPLELTPSMNGKTTVKTATVIKLRRVNKRIMVKM